MKIIFQPSKELENGQIDGLKKPTSKLSIEGEVGEKAQSYPSD